MTKLYGIWLLLQTRHFKLSKLQLQGFSSYQDLLREKGRKRQKMLYILGYKRLFGQAHGQLRSRTFLFRIWSLFKAGMRAVCVKSHSGTQQELYTPRGFAVGGKRQSRSTQLLNRRQSVFFFFLLFFLSAYCMHIIENVYRQLGMSQHLMIFSVSLNEWLFKRGSAVAARKACFTGGVVELTHSQGKVTKILMEITLLQRSHLRTKPSLFQPDRQISRPIRRWF